MTGPEAKVAVVTRTKERPAFLSRAANSVGGQSFSDLVWVIVNDGGASEPVEAEAERARASGVRVAVVHHDTSRGMEAASNVGIQATRSDYIAIHDDDDSWHPNFLAKTAGLLDRQARYVSVVTHTIEVDEDWRNGSLRELRRRRFRPCPRVIYLADLFVGNLFPPISHLFRREAYDRAGGFDETFPVLGDWEFNLRLALEGDIAVVPEPLACYHVRRKADGSDPASNTVTAARWRHREQDALFRNALLRKAIREGHVPEGLLVSIHRLSPLQRIVSMGRSAVLRRAWERMLGQG